MATKEFGVIFSRGRKSTDEPREKPQKRKGTNDKLFLHVSSDKLGSFCFS